MSLGEPPTGCLPLAAGLAYDVRGREGEPFQAEHGRGLGWSDARRAA